MNYEQAQTIKADIDSEISNEESQTKVQGTKQML